MDEEGQRPLRRDRSKMECGQSETDAVSEEQQRRLSRTAVWSGQRWGERVRAADRRGICACWGRWDHGVTSGVS